MNLSAIYTIIYLLLWRLVIIINFGEELKNLRRQKGVTQDELAVYLNITFQAVSRWERNDGLPEISLLPLIADFFGVTVDELLGLGTEKSRDRIKDYLKRGSLLFNQNNVEDSIAVLRDGLKEFPNSYEIMCNLVYALSIQFPGLDERSRKDCDNEIVSLGNRLLYYCTDDILRFKAKEALCRHYNCNLKNSQKANELARTMPVFNYLHQQIIANTYEGDEKIKRLQSLVNEHVQALDSTIDVLLQYDNTINDIDKIKLYEAVNKVYAILFDAGDYDNNLVAGNHIKISLLMIENGNIAGALSALEKVVACAISYDETEDGKPLESLLFNRLTVYNKNYEEALERLEMRGINLSRYVIDNVFNSQSFAAIADTENFKTLKLRLRTYLAGREKGGENET